MVSPEPDYWIHVVSPILVILRHPRPANGCLRELKLPKAIVPSRTRARARQETRRSRHRNPLMSPALCLNTTKGPCKMKRSVPFYSEVTNNLRYSNYMMIMISPCVWGVFSLEVSAYAWIVHANNVRLGTGGVGVAVGKIFHGMGVVVEFRRDTRLGGATWYAYFEGYLLHRDDG